MELKDILEIFKKKDKLDIRGKILKLVCSGTLLTFVILGVFSFISMIIIWDTVYDRGKILERHFSTHLKHFVKEDLREHLQEIAKAKSRRINDGLINISSDVNLTVEHLEEILISSQNYSPMSLPNIMETDVDSGKSFILYSSDLKNNLTPEIEEEISIVSNAGSFMEILSDVTYKDLYSRIFFGSKHGYLVSVNSLKDSKAKVNFESAFSEDYDPRTRPWYIEAVKNDSLIFTDVYSGSDGYRVTCAMPYHDANGNIAGVVGIGNRLDMLDDLYFRSGSSSKDKVEFVLNDKGEIIMVLQDENVLSAGMQDIRQTNQPTLVNVAKRMMAGEIGVEMVTVGDEEYYLAFAPIELTNWSFGIMSKETFAQMSTKKIRQTVLLEMNDFQQGLKNFFLSLSFISFIILALIMVFLIKNGVKVSDNFAKPIKELSDGVRELSRGNFNKKLNIHTGDEIEHLAVCFNAMTDELQNYIENLTKVTADKERMATELNVAEKIQMSMLPHEFPVRDDCEIFATMNAAKEVGGDFYDFYFLDEKHLVVTVADVSGKGVPAAIFMAMSKTILKNYALMMQNPDDFTSVMACTNNQLCQNNREKMFVTVFLGMLNLETGKFVYVNGGHNFPLVYSTLTKKFEYLNVKKSCLLGVKKNLKFQQQSLQLSRGDILFLYTDGVTEAMNEDYEEYLPERLEETLNRANKDVPLNDILDFVAADVKKHSGDAEQSDDITMLAVKWKG